MGVGLELNEPGNRDEYRFLEKMALKFQLINLSLNPLNKDTSSEETRSQIPDKALPPP